MSAKPLKPVEWVASSRKDMQAMPEDVQDTFGFALYLAQLGDKFSGAKPLKGFSGAGVAEHLYSARRDGNHE
jgi:phage-related protein